MSQNPTALVHLIEAHLEKRNAFDSATLRSLAKFAGDVARPSLGPKREAGITAFINKNQLK